MYTFEATSKLNVSMFNRTYAKGKIDVKNLTVTLSYSNDTPINLDSLQKSLSAATYLLDGRILIQNNDPFLIHLLEPKTGATVHNLLNTIRDMSVDYMLLGDTLPPDTISGYKLTIFNSATYSATLEGIALFIHTIGNYTASHKITLDDGTFKVSY